MTGTLTVATLRAAMELMPKPGPRWETLYVPRSYLSRLARLGDLITFEDVFPGRGIAVVPFDDTGTELGTQRLGLLVESSSIFPGARPPETKIVRLP